MSWDEKSLKVQHEAYKSARGKSNENLWHLCVGCYEVVGAETQRISDSLGCSVDSVRNWHLVGWLAQYCEGVEIRDEHDVITLKLLWESDGLSFDHFLRAAKTAKRYETSPADVLEGLILAVEGNQTAVAMEREIETRNEDPDELFRRDVKKMTKSMESFSPLLEYKGASSKLVRAANYFLKRLKSEVE